jgi:hypothetical protein
MSLAKATPATSTKEDTIRLVNMLQSKSLTCAYSKIKLIKFYSKVKYKF